MIFTKLIETTLKHHLPFSVIFELTYRCNLRCQHCYVVKKNKDELSLSEIKMVLKQLKKAGGLVLTLTGGEVFLREDILKILEYAHKLEFLIKIYTNGTLITQETIKYLKDITPFSIEISIYGSNSFSHDKITQVSGSFKTSLENIKRIKENGLSVKLKCPLMRQNIKEYPKIISLAKKLNIEYLFDPIITPKSNGCKTPLKFRIEDKNLKQIFYDKNLRNTKKTKIKPITSYLTQFYNIFFCNAGFNSCAISPYGDVYPCIQFLVKLGNLRKNTFKNIWQKSKNLKKIQKITWQNLEECKNCKLIYFCPRCPGLAYLEEGSLLKKSIIACKIARIKQELKKCKK